MPALTATDRRVLEYLRDGLHDAEIAVRVSLPLFAVKERIHALMRDAGVADRDALVAWYARQPRPLAGAVARAGAFGRRRWLAAGGVLAVGLLVVAFFALPAGDDAPPALEPMATPFDVQTRVASLFPSPTPTVTPTPTPPPIAEPLVSRTSVGNAFDVLVEFQAQQGALRRRFSHPDVTAGVLMDQLIWEVPVIAGETPIVLTDSIGSLVVVGFHSRLRPFPTYQVAFGTTSGAFGAPLDLPANTTPRFIVDGQVAVVGNPAAPSEWMLLSASGRLNPLEPPAAATGAAIGAIPGHGVIWQAEGGLFIDEAGEPVFVLEHEGRTPDAVGRMVYQGYRNLDVSAVPPEEVPDYFVPGGLVLVQWAVDGHALVSQVSLATGEAMYTYEGYFAPVGNLLFGFAGMYCPTGDRCHAAVLNHGGGFARLRDVGENVLASAPAPFAVALEPCAPVHFHEPGGAEMECFSPGRLLATVLTTDDWFEWDTDVTVDADGREWVHVVLGEELDGWVPADAVAFGRGYRGFGLN